MGNLKGWNRMNRAYVVKHLVKSWPAPFSAVWYGEKNHEIRFNDRDYKVGDTVRMLEYKPEEKIYTGRKVDAIITYLRTQGVGLQEGFCVFDFVILNHYSTRDGKDYLVQVGSIFRGGGVPPIPIVENPEA